LDPVMGPRYGLLEWSLFGRCIYGFHSNQLLQVSRITLEAPFAALLRLTHELPLYLLCYDSLVLQLTY